METYLICLAAALIGGLMLSRVTKLVNLPAVTAYLVAGLLIGPFCIGALGVPGLGFNTAEQVSAPVSPGSPVSVPTSPHSSAATIPAVSIPSTAPAHPRFFDARSAPKCTSFAMM